MARTKKTSKAQSLFEKEFGQRTRLDDAYLDARRAVASLALRAQEALDRLDVACESGAPLEHPLPSASINGNWSLVDTAAASERALTALKGWIVLAGYDRSL